MLILSPQEQSHCLSPFCHLQKLDLPFPCFFKFNSFLLCFWSEGTDRWYLVHIPPPAPPPCTSRYIIQKGIVCVLSHGAVVKTRTLTSAGCCSLKIFLFSTNDLVLPQEPLRDPTSPLVFFYPGPLQSDSSPVFPSLSRSPCALRNIDQFVVRCPSLDFSHVFSQLS